MYYIKNTNNFQVKLTKLKKIIKTAEVIILHNGETLRNLGEIKKNKLKIVKRDSFLHYIKHHDGKDSQSAEPKQESKPVEPKVEPKQESKPVETKQESKPAKPKTEPKQESKSVEPKQESKPTTNEFKTANKNSNDVTKKENK